jgi:hypothetical protein
VIDLDLVRTVVREESRRVELPAVAPDAPSLSRATARLAIAAWSPLDVEEVDQRVSFYVPRLVRDVRELLGRIPAATLVAEGIDLDGGLVYLSSRAWDVDGATLAGVWAHERGHHLRDKAVRAAVGVVGSALWGGAYLVHPTIRGWEEGTCYTCDVAARVILAGDDPDAVARGALVSLRGYDLTAQGEAIATAAIRSAAASLKAGALPGVGTPLHETLRALRAKGADFERWNDVIDAEVE